MTAQDSIAQKLKQTADSKFDLTAARKTLEEKINQNLLVSVNGGSFRVTPELIAFVTAWPGDMRLFLKDIYNQPVELDRNTFLTEIRGRYQIAMNAWHVEYDQLSKMRGSKSV